jgi:hypothetical protein
MSEIQLFWSEEEMDDIGYGGSLSNYIEYLVDLDRKLSFLKLPVSQHTQLLKWSICYMLEDS